jgi:hypothetical protein
MMPGTSQQSSEVVCLLAQISSEYEAAQQALFGLAQGVSLHQFISQRTERIGELHSQLYDLVGASATALIAAQLDQLPDESQVVEREKEDTVNLDT